MDYKKSQRKHSKSWFSVGFFFAAVALSWIPFSLLALTLSDSGTVSITAVVLDGSSATTTSTSGAIDGFSGGKRRGGSNSSIKINNQVVFQGTSTPRNIVSLLKDGKSVAETVTASDGGFRIVLKDLRAGTYNFGLIAKDEKGMSSSLHTYSIDVISGVTTLVQGIALSVTTNSASPYDLNGDTHVDIADFSILAYWYKRANPPLSIDMNDDGVVDLTDFSILAYYWTG